MGKIELTGTLKTYKAVIIHEGDSFPEGYHEIAGVFLPDGEVTIAVPENLAEDIELLNKLSKQAGDCLYKAYQANPSAQISDMRDN